MVKRGGAGIPSLSSFSKCNMLWFRLCRLDMQPRGTGDGWKSGDAFPISDRSLAPSPRIWVGLELLRPTGRSETDARLALGGCGLQVWTGGFCFLFLGVLGCFVTRLPSQLETGHGEKLDFARRGAGRAAPASQPPCEGARPVSVHSHSTVTLLGPSRPSSCQLSAMEGPHSVAHGTETSPA